MLRSIKVSVLCVCTVIAFSRCADFREVNAFAITGRQLMDQHATVSFGYYDYFHDSAYIYHSMPDHLRDADCQCETEKKADTIITRECNILSAYFGTLALFTDPKSAISLDPIGKSVQSGTYGLLKISDQESGIAAGLATGLSDLFTTGYKSRKLKAFLSMYKDSVAPLIALLKIRANTLSGRIINLQLTLDHVADSLISASERKDVKWAILIAYEQRKKSLDEIYTMYQRRETDFKKVLDAGQLVYENMSGLQSKAFKQKLKVLVSDLALNANIK